MIFRFGRFELNGARYELSRDGEPVAIEPRVLEVLEYLVSRRDRVIPKEEFLDVLWADVEVSESALTRTIKKARQVLDDPSWIKAVYGRGYTFEGSVLEIPVSAASASGDRWSLRRSAPILVALLALILAASVFFRESHPKPLEDAAATTLSSSRAVLPLQDLSPDSMPERVQPEAYRAYLLGRYHTNRRTIEDLEESVENLSQAIRLDPSYAPAYAALADAHILLSTYYGSPPAAAFEKAREAVDTALALNPQLSEAHASRGVISLAMEWDFPAAEEAYRQALELAPGNASAHQWYAELLSILGRHPEAVAHGRRAWELDPLSPVINAALGQRLNAAGRWGQALEQLATALELDPAFAWIHRERAYAFTHLGQIPQALDERLREMQVRGLGEQDLATLQQAMQAEGMPGFWRWELRRLERRGRDFYVPALLRAEAWEGSGQRKRALEHLLDALEERGDHVLQLTTSPELQALALDPRIRARLVEVGLGHLGSS